MFLSIDRSARQFARAGVVAATALLVACGGGDKDRPADGAAPKLRVALLTPGPISDKSWNGSAYEGLLRLRDSLGAEVSHIQTKTPAEFEENFRQYGAQNYRLVFGHGFEFQDAASRVAPSYPNTIYVVTSGRVTGQNLAGVAFLFEEASYQAGMIAGSATRTNKLGLIAGTELPPVKASFEAFTRGAKSVNPKVEVITSYVGNWDDVSAGKEQALAQLARGVDVIFQNADAAGLGVFQAVKEKKALAFGTNANQNAIAPDVILGSVVIDLPKAFMLIGREVQSGAFQGRVIHLGIKDDVVRLELNDALADRISAATRAAVDSVGAELKAGTFRALADMIGRDSATTPATAPAAPSKP
ncbi:MAG TPA: BMP family ABC transporter substrate-binding protein [Gemmatimonas aurantiaca]|uniref:BMP family ABC transporter substrate-binding protein n=2 Tax=Gemmatimonas aurantiaca TaxID=173480 RepID=A0A3D4VCP4_9BACT|nr:BMP family protein [Gemmatimonas aurantiaca]BAH37068.1 putative lipoprotein [Gemmatimonas aurantiaca T-27]HCT58900.1 BMP family ABC transporter substrate-binding protein [Gemmatimonas aurantiaca]